jgi:hypothetical protein
MGDLCRRIVAGSHIMIHYSAKSPKHNIASDLVAALWNYVVSYLLPACCFLRLRLGNAADSAMILSSYRFAVCSNKRS